MKKGYWVVAYRSISDASAVKAYGALAVPAVQSFGGRFLTMSASQMQDDEAGLQQPTVLAEFDFGPCWASSCALSRPAEMACWGSLMTGEHSTMGITGC